MLAGAAMMPAFAQVADPEPVADPNRIIVDKGNFNYQGFVIDRVENIHFVHVDGPVAAYIDIEEVAYDHLSVSISRSDACQNYLLCVMPYPIASLLTDDALMANYVADTNRSGAITLSENFDRGTLSGIELNPGSDYMLVTVGLDSYGVPSDVERAEFSTPRLPVSGNPEVQLTFTNITQRTATFTATPNGDCSTYYYVLFGKGEMEAQYQQFASMFGFSSRGEMIMKWGSEHSGVTEYTYKDIEPNTDYEIYVQPLDKDGHMGDLQCFGFTTSGMGGSGAAYVEIQLGDYRLTDWGSGDKPEMLPSQFVKFIPNDQSAKYRFGVYLAKTYDENPEAVKQDVCSEPPMPNMANWFFFEPMETDYQINPDTEAVVLAAAKNIDGEWGEINIIRFTTPHEAAPAKAPRYVGSQRFPINNVAKGAAIMAGEGRPMILRPAGIQLTK